MHGTINGMGERAGNANLGEVALTLRALYGVESNLRLDRIRDVSARVRELSGYELEPWKPVTGETLYRRESGAVASQFHDPQSIEPYSSELVATERSIVLGKKSGLDSIRIKAEELGLDVPEERRAEVLAAVKQRRDGEARPRHRRRVQGDRWLSTTRSIVGSGVNGLACGALLAQAGWRVCVLERNDWFGGAIKTAELTAPGFRHDVFSAWHPLWVGGAGARAARRRPRRARARVPEHRAADRRRSIPDGESAFLLRTAEANAAELDRHHPGDGDAWIALLAEFFPNADLAFGVLGTELWSRHGAALGAKAVRRLGRRARRSSRASCSSRRATGSRRRSCRSGRTACSRRGCCTPGSGPTRPRPATWRR